MISVDVRADVRSAAFAALKRLSRFNSNKVVRNLVPEMNKWAHESYEINRRGFQGAGEHSTIYQLVKQAVLPRAVLGHMTGTTPRAIGAFAVGGSVYAGFVKPVKYPDTTQDYKAPLSKVLAKLETKWGMSGLNAFTGQFNFDRSDVHITWGGDGVSIKWPEAAKRIFRLQDISFPSGVVHAMQYKNNRQDRFFHLPNNAPGEAMQVLDAYVDRLWGRSAPSVANETGPEIDSDVAEVFTEQTASSTNERVQLAEIQGRVTSEGRTDTSEDVETSRTLFVDTVKEIQRDVARKVEAGAKDAAVKQAITEAEEAAAWLAANKGWDKGL